jgi:aerobic carbon-monoxide dehydrogenase small subunit
MSERVTVTFTLNGASRTVSVPPMKRLLDVLREDCAATGTKEGCGEGECGACTVLLDGLAVNSCLVPAVHAEGAKVTTVEGLAMKGRLSVLQQAFVDMGAAQCGMCTPGMLVTSAALLASTKGRVPSDAEVREALAGTLCRCTGYQKIVDAVRAAAKPARKPKVAARTAKARKPAGKKKAAKKSAVRARAAKRPAKPAGRRPADLLINKDKVAAKQPPAGRRPADLLMKKKGIAAHNTSKSRAARP